MFKKVTSNKDHELFEAVWNKVCKEKGFIFEPSKEFAARYILDDGIGTIEFIPYNPKVFSTVENHFPFSSIEDIRKYPDRTYEIDKLCLVSDKRSKGYIWDIMGIMFQHSKKTNAKYYVALMDLAFFRALRIVFGLDIKQMGKTINRPARVIERNGQAIHIPTCALVPILFDTDTLYQNSYDWLQEIG